MARWNAEDLLISFDSTHAAMAAQKLLADVSPMVIPTPKTITASCGMTLVVKKEHTEHARELIETRVDIAAACNFHLASSL